MLKSRTNEERIKRINEINKIIKERERERIKERLEKIKLNGIVGPLFTKRNFEPKPKPGHYRPLHVIPHYYGIPEKQQFITENIREYNKDLDYDYDYDYDLDYDDFIKLLENNMENNVDDNVENNFQDNFDNFKKKNKKKKIIPIFRTPENPPPIYPINYKSKITTQPDNTPPTHRYPPIFNMRNILQASKKQAPKPAGGKTKSKTKKRRKYKSSRV